MDVQSERRIHPALEPLGREKDLRLEKEKA